jgi:membrane fusion protein (multidrug efflux system)
VLTVGADNKVVQTPVIADTASGADWLITSGLKAGDRVIVAGSQKARTGAVVKPVDVAGATPDAPASSATAENAGSAPAAHS